MENNKEKEAEKRVLKLGELYKRAAKEIKIEIGKILSGKK